jgi:hypothetical protein
MAAGLGFKTFVSGDVLSAGDTNGYLMQGVLVFASAAARDAAITSPQEGQFAYLKDTNVTTYYTGSAWANLDTTGMTNPMTTTGDSIYSSSGSTPARLGIGSTGQVLTVAAGLPSWATPAAGSPSWSLLSSTSLTTGSSYSITGLSGYNQLLIRVNAVTTTQPEGFSYTLNNVTTSSYNRTISFFSGGAALSLNSLSNSTTLLASNSNSPAATAVSGSFLIDGANGAGLKFVKNSIGANSSAASNNTQFGVVTFTDSNVISSFQINATFGTFNGGTITVFGSVI